MSGIVIVEENGQGRYQQAVIAGEQRARLLEIANKCPVHRALTQSLAIESRLVD